MKRRGDEAVGDAKRGGDEKGAARVSGDIHHGGFGVIYGIADMACTVVEDAAILGGLQRAGGAAEQADAEVFFEVGDAGRADGGGGALIAGGGTHRAQSGDAHDHADGVDTGHLWFFFAGWGKLSSGWG